MLPLPLPVIYPAHAGINLHASNFFDLSRIYPAHAGINLTVPSGRVNGWYLPRTRGDKPPCRSEAFLHLQSTPHTRG